MRILAGLVIFQLAWVSTAEAKDIEIPFEIGGSESVILVRGTANGKPALMILDTGSSRTIVRPELLGPSPSALAPSAFSDSGPGLRAQGRWTVATIRLGEMTWRHSVVAMNFDEVSKAFGLRVDGLIGQDILREYDRVTIDFREGKILLSRTPKGERDPPASGKETPAP